MASNKRETCPTYVTDSGTWRRLPSGEWQIYDPNSNNATDHGWRSGLAGHLAETIYRTLDTVRQALAAERATREWAEEHWRIEHEGLTSAMADVLRLEGYVLGWWAAGIISEGKAAEVLRCDRIAARDRLLAWRDANPEDAAAADRWADKEDGWAAERVKDRAELTAAQEREARAVELLRDEAVGRALLQYDHRRCEAEGRQYLMHYDLSSRRGEVLTAEKTTEQETKP